MDYKNKLLQRNLELEEQKRDRDRRLQEAFYKLEGQSVMEQQIDQEVTRHLERRLP